MYHIWTKLNNSTFGGYIDSWSPGSTFPQYMDSGCIRSICRYLWIMITGQTPICEYQWIDENIEAYYFQRTIMEHIYKQLVKNIINNYDDTI